MREFYMKLTVVGVFCGAAGFLAGFALGVRL